MVLGLSVLGLIHTLISLVAIASGAVALLRDGAISPRNPVGRLYVSTTVLTCVTGFGFFFTNPAFTKGQVLGIITILVILVAMAAARGAFGRISAAVETVCYSATFLFNLIPGVVQTTTRLPPSAPLFHDDTAPQLGMINGILFVLFVIVAFLQVRRLRRAG